jgi:AAA ATPase domain
LKEKLIIKNFGPIKHIDLDLGTFNVLIGENATGKSTVAKLLAICRYYSYIRNENRYERGLSNFSDGLIAWGLHDFVKNDSHIYYDCKHYSLSVDQVKPEFATNDVDIRRKDALEQFYIFNPTLIPKSEEFKELLEADREILTRPRKGPINVLPSSFFENNVASVMDNPFYLPTERGLQSVFSLGKGGIMNTTDWLFNQFAQIDKIAQIFGSETDIDHLDITYKSIDGRGYVRKKAESEFYSLSDGASGYQTSIPIVLVSKYYQKIREKVKTLIIEEPELSLFPDAQYKLMQFLVDRANHGNSFFLTTHSPYVLTSLNNLIYAYQTGQDHRIETNNVIGEKYWIAPDNVAVYMLMPDGSCENIFDKEEKLIKAEKIDKVSGKLNEQFTTLLNLEFEKK